jgi:hypothetical protein
MFHRYVIGREITNKPQNPCNNILYHVIDREIYMRNVYLYIDEIANKWRLEDFMYYSDLS